MKPLLGRCDHIERQLRNRPLTELTSYGEKKDFKSNYEMQVEVICILETPCSGV